MSADPKRTVKVTVYLTPAAAARLDQHAAAEHRTRSAAAALLIERALPPGKPRQANR